MGVFSCVEISTPAWHLPFLPQQEGLDQWLLGYEEVEMKRET
jgi:hypothetical protein